MSDTVVETIQALERRAEWLEHEITFMRQELTRVLETIANPASIMARYVIEGKVYEITRADVEAIRTRLARPRSESALYELAVASKVAEELQKRPVEERNHYFFDAVETIRSAAVADGSALDHESEAAIDD